MHRFLLDFGLVGGSWAFGLSTLNPDLLQSLLQPSGYHEAHSCLNSRLLGCFRSADGRILVAFEAKRTFSVQGLKYVGVRSKVPCSQWVLVPRTVILEPSGKIASKP